MQIGVAHARGHHLDQQMDVGHLGHGHVLDDLRLAEFMHDGGFHHLGDGGAPEAATRASVPSRRPAPLAGPQPMMLTPPST